MLRNKLINLRSKKDVIEWRSHDVMRIEAFSDAVFAFSITLLIVSLEVPKNFDDLINAMEGFFPFAICFIILFQIWYSQFKYFRRYGLQDFYPLILNAALIFVVLFYMYPLKYLFDLLIPGGDVNTDLTIDQVRELMLIYGSGYISVHLIFVLLYRNAISYKEELKLTEKELFVTYSELYSYCILLIIGIISVAVAYFADPEDAAYAGWIYILIPLSMYIFFYFRGKVSRQRF